MVEACTEILIKFKMCYSVCKMRCPWIVFPGSLITVSYSPGITGISYYNVPQIWLTAFSKSHFKWKDNNSGGMRWVDLITDLRLISLLLNFVVSIMTMRKIAALCLIPIIKTELGMSRQKAQTALFIYQWSGSICFKCCREEMSNKQPSAPCQQEVKRTFLRHTPCLWIPSLRETHTHMYSRNFFSVKKEQIRLCWYELWSNQTDDATFITVTQFSCHHHPEPSLCRLCNE